LELQTDDCLFVETGGFAVKNKPGLKT